MIDVKLFFVYFSTILIVLFIIHITYDPYSTSSWAPTSTNYKNSYIVSTAQYEKSQYFTSMKKMTFGLARSKIYSEVVEIVQYDMSQPLPPDIVDNIPCIFLKKAEPPYHVCMHNLTKDVVSNTLKEGRVWEEHMQYLIKTFFKSNPDAFYLDIGMNIGVHALYAASLNLNINVLGVEPFPKNVLRAHKAAHLNNVQNRFQVVMAAVSNKRGPVNLTEYASDTANNALLNKQQNPLGNGTKTFASSAILFDDLLPFAPGKKAMLKMDIEGHECYTFFNAEKIFDEIDIPLIAMEFFWTRRRNPPYCVEYMLHFLEKRNYSAYLFPYTPDDPNRKPLKLANYRKWKGWDIYFEKLK